MPKYPLAIRVTHWLMAIIIIGLLCVGLIMTSLPKEDPLRNTLFMLHKSFGILVFILFFVRIFFRVRLGGLPLPEVIPPLERTLAHAGHHTLYLFMVIMPLSGFLMTEAFGRPVPFFGLTMPKVIGVDKDLGHLLDGVHDYGAYILIAILVLHVGAVIWHRVKEHVNLLDRMI